MSESGDEIDSDGSSANLGFEEILDGVNVDAAFNAQVAPDLACVDSGCNRLILRDRPDFAETVATYAVQFNRHLRTASVGGRLPIEGMGMICNEAGTSGTEYKHCPEATTNLVPTYAITRTGATIIIQYDTNVRREVCIIAVEAPHGMKEIQCLNINGLFWITMTQLWDIMLRDGFSAEELADARRINERNLFWSMMNEPRNSETGQKLEQDEVELEDDTDYRAHYGEYHAYHKRMRDAHNEVCLASGKNPRSNFEISDRNNVRYFSGETNLPLANSLKGFLDRRNSDTLRPRSAVSPVSHELKMLYDECYRIGHDVLAVRAAHVADGAADAHVVVDDVESNNGVESFYLSLFVSDLSVKLTDSQPIALLGSSTTTDLLTLMHNRTGHCNIKTLIECQKSKLVKGLKIEDKHIRKFVNSDKHVCDVCARAKITRMAFKKTHAIRGKRLGDYISVDVAVFLNCPSREGYRYVVQFLDHATKHSWVYPMTTRDEFIEKFRDFVDVKLKRHGAKLGHYHADGGGELISKQVLTILKREGARYTWNPADTPELNATTERRFRTLGERALSMIIRSGLPVDFWWDAYEASNYITNRLPTKTVFGYQTPYEGVYGEIPDLSLLRVWGANFTSSSRRRICVKISGTSVMSDI